MPLSDIKMERVLQKVTTNRSIKFHLSNMLYMFLKRCGEGGFFVCDYEWHMVQFLTLHRSFFLNKHTLKVGLPHFLECVMHIFL